MLMLLPVVAKTAAVTALGGRLDRFDFAVIGLYLLGMVALGAMLATRIRAFKDYFLASGALTTPLLVCTLVSSYYGIDVTFGTSESGYYYGVVAWFWYSLPYYFFIASAALVVAPRLRRYGGAMTLSDVLERHYGVRTRVVGAMACYVYSAPIIAMAGLMTMMELIGVPTTWGVIVVIVVCAMYTIMGGLWADAISDTVQFVLMCVSLAIAIPLAIEWVGGWSFVTYLPPSGDGGLRNHLVHHGGLSGWMLLAWSLTGVTVLVEPAFYQRVFAASDGRSVQRALLVGILLWASYDWGATLLGLVAHAAVAQGLLPESLAGKQALVSVCLEMLPTGLRGLMVGGIIAAAMSQVDSYALLASGNLVYDIYRPLFDREASDKRLLRLTRIGVFAVMFASALASLLFDRMRDAWQFMASVMASVVLVPVMAAIFARPRRAAGFWGAVGGLAGLAGFYALLFTQGMKDPHEETYIWRVGGIELWQDYAVLCALPASLGGFVLGHWLEGGEP
ncbi:MAG: sodium:solute symporter family protein [Pirellulales bacterium]|nr:sodium:solute symporter family protein [Pirellulales bacterium]